MQKIGKNVENRIFCRELYTRDTRRLLRGLILFFAMSFLLAIPAISQQTIVIVPSPQELKLKDEMFTISSDTVIIIGDNYSDQDVFTAELLQKDIEILSGKKLNIVSASKDREKSGFICLGEPETNSLIKKLCRKNNKTVTRNMPGPEGYILESNSRYVMVAGYDKDGTFYGVQTLRQLLENEQGKTVVHGASIEDWPDLKFRGVHLALSAHSANPVFLKRLFAALASLKLNSLVLDFNGNMEYDSHPDIGPLQCVNGVRVTPFKKAEVKEIVSFAKKNHFEVIPIVGLLSYARWILHWPKYQYLAEEPEVAKKGFYDYYCPSNPDTYKVVFDLMKEIIEVFQPAYFNIGHDEVFKIGFCERCKHTPPFKLFADDIIKLHDFLAKRNIKTMMWGDQLILKRGGRPDLRKALPLIPKDVIIGHWDYDPEPPPNRYSPFKFPLKRWKDKGFEVFAIPCTSPKNIYRMCQEVKKEGTWGIMGTTHALVVPRRVVSSMLPIHWAAEVLTAEYSWSTGSAKPEDISYEPVEEIAKRIYCDQKPLRVKKFNILDISPFCNQGFIDNKMKKGWLGYGVNYDLRNIPQGKQEFRNIPFKVITPQENKGNSCIILTDKHDKKNRYPIEIKGIPVRGKARSFIFFQTCSRSHYLNNHRSPGDYKIGEYQIVYVDGSKETVDIIYNYNVSSWSSDIGAFYSKVAWKGKTQGETAAQISLFEWENPRPEKEIISISFVSTKGEAKPVLIGITARGYTPSGKETKIKKETVSLERGTETGIVASKTIKCKKTSVSPLIDGKLNDAAWKKATNVSDFLIGGTKKLAIEQTKAYLTYDNQKLYIAFQCHESDMKALKIKENSRDSLDIFRDDVVEIFLDVQHDRESFIQLVVDAKGTQFDIAAKIKGSEKDWFDAPLGTVKWALDKDWNASWESKTKLNKSFWAVELAIPFDALGKIPHPGDIWGINLCRERRGEEVSSWVYINRDDAHSHLFHCPSQFGNIVFGE